MQGRKKQPGSRGGATRPLVLPAPNPPWRMSGRGEGGMRQIPMGIGIASVSDISFRDADCRAAFSAAAARQSVGHRWVATSLFSWRICRIKRPPAMSHTRGGDTAARKAQRCECASAMRTVAVGQRRQGRATRKSCASIRCGSRTQDRAGRDPRAGFFEEERQGSIKG